MDNLFSTHPAVENRIAQLQEIASSMGTGYSPRTSSVSRVSGVTGPKAPPRGPWG
jgi:heat shock protein HtpX